jgi:adenylate cyclase class IV
MRRSAVATNIEWKARARDAARQRELAAGRTGAAPELLEQVDTFFNVPHGRLKLRQFASDRGELIYYERPDRAGPKASNYTLVPTPQPEALRDVLARALGVGGVVRKRRWLYHAGPARIHVDEVDGLGTFLEVEVVLRPGQAPAEGERLADELRRELQVADEDLIDVAYLDLLRPGREGSCAHPH